MNSNATLNPVAQKCLDLRDVLSTEFVERDEVIHTALLALVSRTHHFTLSQPGTAKSLLVKRLVHHIDGLDKGEYFERLLTRFSNYNEIFGSVDVMALNQGVYRLLTGNKLPEAIIAFIDEVFKANSSILNAMLKMLNEREFENEYGEPYKTQLSTVFCASNELPQGEELAALWDRIHFRMVSDVVQEPGNFIRMLKLKHSEEPAKVVTWNEILEAQRGVDHTEINNDVYEALADLRGRLHKENIEPSDRRFRECLRVVQAQAFLNGNEVAEIGDMTPINHILWTHMDNRKMVNKLVMNLASPLDRQAMDYLEDVDRLDGEYRKFKAENDSAQLVNKKATEVASKLKKIQQDIGKLESEINQSGKRSVKLDELKKRLHIVTDNILNDFGLNEDD